MNNFVLEPTGGFEPPTCCLRNSCSATELRWPKVRICSLEMLAQLNRYTLIQKMGMTEIEREFILLNNH